MNFVTSGDIAEKLGADRDSVCYALRKLKVEPVGRAGIVRMFPESAMLTVKEFLDSQQQSKVANSRRHPVKQ